LQPHTFSRTRSLWDQWPAAFREAAVVLVGDIYPAREQGDPVALAQSLVDHLIAHGIPARYAGPSALAPSALLAVAQSGDVVLTLGAGDSDQVAAAFLEQCSAMSEER